MPISGTGKPCWSCKNKPPATAGGFGIGRILSAAEAAFQIMFQPEGAQGDHGDAGEGAQHLQGVQQVHNHTPFVIS